MKHLSLVGLIVLFVLNSLKSYSQDTIRYYSYDPSGNRKSKSISLLKSGKINEPDSSKIAKKESLKDDTFSKQVIRIYPNPTKGFLEIEIPEDPENSSPVQIQVFDLYGKLIIDKPQQPLRMILDLNNQPNGIYLLNFKKGQLVSQWKIIKQ